MISLSCPHCQRAMRAPAHAAGRKARCPACRAELFVPAPAPAPLAVARSVSVPVLFPAEPEPEPRPVRRRWSLPDPRPLTFVIPIGAVAGLLALLAVVTLGPRVSALLRADGLGAGTPKAMTLAAFVAQRPKAPTPVRLALVYDGPDRQDGNKFRVRLVGCEGEALPAHTTDLTLVFDRADGVGCQIYDRLKDGELYFYVLELKFTDRPEQGFLGLPREIEFVRIVQEGARGRLVRAP